MDDETIKEIFNLYFKGKNFMTPDIIEYGCSDTYLYEFASGTGIERGTKMYGVTVIEILPGFSDAMEEYEKDATEENRDKLKKLIARDSDKSKCFHSMGEALSHVRSL